MESHRNARGFSLVTVMIVVTLSALWLAGVSAMVLSIYRDVSKSRLEGELKNITESTIDYYVANLNGSDRAEFDADPGETVVKTIPPSAIGAPTNAVISISLTNAGPIDTNALIYEQRLDNNQPHSVYTENPWRVLTATVVMGVTSKSLSVVLKPYLASTPSQTGNKSFFPYGILATDTLAMNQSTTQAVQPDNLTNIFVHQDDTDYNLAGDVGALGSVSVSNSTISGDIIVGDTLSGTASVNGSIQGIAPPDGFPPPLNLKHPSFEPPDISTISLPPPLEPSSVPETNQLSQIDGTASLKSGDYVASSIDVNISSAITTDITNSTPVRVFLNEQAPGDPVTVHGNINTNDSGTPNNFQIWYNGTGVLNLDGEQMNALIYAPNATVNIGNLSAAQTQFHGSIIAKNVTVSNSQIQYHAGLRSANPIPGFASEDYDTSSSNMKYRVVSVLDN